jgi:hypothetical protein
VLSAAPQLPIYSASAARRIRSALFPLLRVAVPEGSPAPLGPKGRRLWSVWQTEKLGLQTPWTAIEALLFRMGVYDPKADLSEQFVAQAAGLLELDRLYTDDEDQLLGAYGRS